MWVECLRFNVGGLPRRTPNHVETAQVDELAFLSESHPFAPRLLVRSYFGHANDGELCNRTMVLIVFFDWH